MSSNKYLRNIFNAGLCGSLAVGLMLSGGCGKSEPSGKAGSAGEQKSVQIASGYGSISLGVMWLGKARPGAKSVSPLDCGASRVVNVEAAVYDSSNKLLVKSEPWPCKARSGTIQGVPAGANYAIVALGKGASGVTLFRAQTSGITVVADKINDAGALTASSFTPAHLGPPNKARGNMGYISVVWSATAVKYRVQFSKDASFAKPEIDATVANATMYTPVNLPSGSYYWRVAAQDDQGNASAWSSPETIVLVAGR